MAGRKRGLFGFKTFAERGAWVEMLFMAAASFHGFRVLKPWGEVSPYDVGVEGGGRLLRVQVKSTSHKEGNETGYRCEFMHRSRGRTRRYSPNELDVCVAYVIQEKLWYIIPAHRIAGPKGRSVITLGQQAEVRNRATYEQYREAWGLLGKDRSELNEM